MAKKSEIDPTELSSCQSKCCVLNLLVCAALHSFALAKTNSIKLSDKGIDKHIPG